MNNVNGFMATRSVGRHIVFVLVLCLTFGFLSNDSKAALKYYQMTQGGSTKIDASGGTKIWQHYGSGTRYSYGDWTGSQLPFNVASGLLTLPFSFTFDGTAYTQLRVYMSGAITLGSGSMASSSSNNLTSGTAGMPVIAAFWEDLHLTGPGPGCWNPYVSYTSTGSAPNRVFTIQWNDMEAAYQSYYGSPYGIGNRVSFQIQLHESGKIVFYYDKMEWTPSCGYWSGQIGNNVSGSIGFTKGSTDFLSVTPTATASVSSTAANNSINLQSPTISSGTNYSFVKLPEVRMSATPKIIDYGTVSAGAFVDANVVIKHVSTEGVLNILSTTISGLGASQFSVVSTPGPLNPGQQGNLVVRFTPTLNGTHLATLTINSNGVDSGTQQILLSGKAIAPTIEITPIGNINTATRMFKKTRTMVGDSLRQSFVVKNIGEGTLVIKPTSGITGEFASHYQITRWPVYPIGAGLTDTMSITFMPTQDGSLPARANIDNNATNGTQYIDLFGVGVVPRIELTPGEMLTFDSVAMGTTVCKRVKIFNSGTDTLRITKDYLSSSDGDFTYTGLPRINGEAKIAPNDSAFVNVCITPLQKGTRRARLRFTTNIPLTFEGNGGNVTGTIYSSQGQQAWVRRDTSAKAVEIWANAVPSDKSIIAMGDFPDAVIGTESSALVTMNNAGSDPITVEEPFFSGVNASLFKATKANFPVTVAPGSSFTFTVVATPALRGTNTAVMNIANASEDRQYLQAVNLTVNGLLARSSVNETALSFEKLYLGEESSKTITVSNTGDVDQVYTATLVGAGFTLTSDAVSDAVAPGSSAVYTVKFAPTLKGASSGTLTFTSTHIADMSVSLNGEADEKPVSSVKADVSMKGFVLSQNSPNPATGKTSFTFTTPTTSDVRIILADVTGKTVRELAKGVYGAGEHTVNMITGDIASGSYLYILESEGVRLVRQMVITK